MNDLLNDLHEPIEDWDREAKDRHIDGMAASADTLRACRDELRRIVKRHERRPLYPKEGGNGRPKKPKP
ncbi:hypothetical protein [Stenotrophomonas sp. NLF4-10]|uniref:hypothetical protein n=1 Tax=Stenotrophomonas sp. NLF4-10 TaxID=2918754 RepID=UPI001EFAAF08|nr:hypothetical protein [Stenotrophomonas sp. NLF4-10]MCG8275423.1 hypothetical protein [Stenotrophomonas sp. NLF4-10]